MKLLLVSDAPWHATGYGTQIKFLAERMIADGHRVVVFCPGAFMGGKDDNWNNTGITVVGGGGGDDRWGNRSIGEIVNWYDPDLILTWLDIHGMGAYGWHTQPTFMWAPIDTAPTPKIERTILARAERIMACSAWGQKTLMDDGIEADYIPCAIDINAYDISDEGRQNWRAQMRPEIDDETFLIGMVGLNTGSPDRKGYGYALDVIKKFVDNHPGEKIRAYIHTDPNGDGVALPLIDMREELGLVDVVAFSPPQLPWGMPALYMRDMYNAFDVLMHTSPTEGFGVPVIEAQACGTPVVVNACTSVTELASGPGGYKAKPEGEMWVNTVTKIFPPSVASMTLMLEAAYADWKAGVFTATKQQSIRTSVLKYDVDYVYDNFWRPVLGRVPARIDYEVEGSKIGKKLLLAAGGEEREGFVHHDKALLHPHITIAHDLNVFPWPFADDEYGYVEMTDVLEHLKGDLTEVMDELHRIVAPGGYVYIHTAEAGSWQLMKDPTHVQGFFPNSLNYYDPETPEGGYYVYSEKKWKVHRATADAAGLVFVLAPRKNGVTIAPKPEVVTV